MSIISSLGYGSGIDVQSTVAQLTAAAKAPKEAQIKARETVNGASVSSLATVSGGIDRFAASLKSLIAGGTLATQPTASDESVVGVRALTGARLGEISHQLEVRQLAQAQTLSSATAAAKTDTVGRGTLTLNVGGKATDIAVGAGNDTVAGVAAAINAAKAGVTASVVSSSGGVRLVLKGATGAAAAFTLSAAPDGSEPATPALALGALAYDPGTAGGMTLAQGAQDALVRLDGVELSRPANSVSDLIPGVAVDLKKVAVGATVTIGTARPTEAIRTAMSDFVAAFNEMKGLVDEATAAKNPDGTGGGALRGDLGMRDMARRLARLTSTPLVADGSRPATLAEIGVVTGRDGKLTLNEATLSATLTASPDAVEALFNPTQRSSSPFVTVTNLAGAVAPGSYMLTNLVPQAGAVAASGLVDGVAMVGLDNSLSAPAGFGGKGLIVQASAPVANATVTVDLGLGGALQSIRDALRATTGPLASTSSRLTKEAALIAKDRTAMETRSTAYQARLTADFTAMETRVSAFKATQSYLEQQVKIWTKSG